MSDGYRQRRKNMKAQALQAHRDRCKRGQEVREVVLLMGEDRVRWLEAGILSVPKGRAYYMLTRDVLETLDRLQAFRWTVKPWKMSLTRGSKKVRIRLARKNVGV